MVIRKIIKERSGIHDKPLDERFNKEKHICVSCDVVDYTAVAINIERSNFFEFRY